MFSTASNAHLNLTACRQAARSSLTDGAALADCIFSASFSDRRSEAKVGRWLKLGNNNLDFHALPTSARIEQPFVEQWHLTTQNILFRHLRQLWADDRPRVMVDIGCHAGHSRHKNLSDATLWLDHFEHPGGTVLGVDLVEDYALDLQHRLDHVQPYTSLAVRKLTRTLAIGKRDGGFVRAGVDLLGGCTGNWLEDWDKFERTVNLDHYCRIPRQRLRLGSAEMVAKREATLPTPPPRRYPADAKGEAHVPTMRLDSLWAEALGGKHIDFLKVDIDKSWQKIGMERVLSERGASLIVMEVDISWPKLADKLGGVTHLDQLCWRAVKQGYTPLLKVPCTAKTGVKSEGGRATWYHPLVPEGLGTCVPFGWHVPFATWGIQDVLLVDAVRHPALDVKLRELGRADCVPPRFGRPASRVELRAAAPIGAARRWVEQARVGFCGVTSAVDEPSDCTHGSKGVLGLLPQEAETPLSAARACLARCARCARCRYVSLSRKLADCSWYATCDLGRLSRTVKHFVSGPALARNSSSS